MSQSIGSVFVDFEARTAKLKEGTADAVNTVKKSGEEMGKSNSMLGASGDRMANKLQTGFLRIAIGAGVIAKLRDEIRHTIDNIEKIPGIPAETIASVKYMQASMSEARAVVDGWIAAALSGFAKFGQAIGVTAAMIANAFTGIETDTSALSKQRTPDEEARLKDANFDEKLRAATEKMSEAREKDARAAMSQGNQIAALFEKSQRYETFAKGSAQNSLQSADARSKGYAMASEAGAKLRTMTEQLEATYIKVGEAQEKVSNINRDHVAILRGLKERESEIYIAMAALGPVKEKDGVQTEKRIKLNEQLARTLRGIAIETAKIAEPTRMFTALAVHSFESIGDTLAEMVITGKAKFSDLFKTIAQQVVAMVLKLAIINPIINGIFGAGGLGVIGFQSLATFATGGRPNPGEMSIVGENGPELFIPDGTGTVVTNSALGGMGRGGGDIYQIDARGADTTAVARLEAIIIALNGSIERRAVAANIAASRRGGSIGRGLAA